ncbi:hypothetical protein G5I_14285 [Acromyrmex echinatior]|uniref:Uncharacterized protein n=1 Tax=Acromyrmex echinatior TaxID=103372 RepID=F4X6Z5_ACREC|nr:hypothetical protein G5I_14285 [Acromyrmex echinatior]
MTRKVLTRNEDTNILGDQRDKDLSLEMRRRDKIQRVNEESQGVSLRPSCVVIPEISTVDDNQDRIRVMKTQMRSRHLRYRTAGRVHNNTSWNTSRHPTTVRESFVRDHEHHWFSNGIESHDCPSLLCLFRVSCVFRDFALTRRAQAWISARIYDECEKNLLFRRPVQPRRCPSHEPREHVREDARRFRKRHEPPRHAMAGLPRLAVLLTSGHCLQGKKLFASLATLLPLNDGLPMVLRLFSEMKRIDYPSSMSSGLFYLQPTHLLHLVPFFIR